MKMQLFAKILKCLSSAIAAFLLLTAFCFFYYNVPVHYENTSKSTDYSWEPNVFYSRATEGFAFGKTNNEGFINMFDFSADTTIDILVMGSSHMEAYQVAMDESAASRLDALFPDKTVYNIGVSGHEFLNCLGNLQAAVEQYNPSVVILETGTCYFSDKALSSAVQGTTAEIPSHTGGILSTLQQNQYLRLLYSQMKSFMKKGTDDSNDLTPITGNSDDIEKLNDDMLLSELLRKLNVTAQKNNIIIIILYHPGTAVNPDGTLRLIGNASAKEQLSEKCEENNILVNDD